jgi:hypothetical protein
MNMRDIARTLAIAAFATAFVSSALAQGLPANVSQACTGDYRKLCADVTPGGGRIIACMKAKETQVSEACRAALRDEQAKRGAGKAG